MRVVRTILRMFYKKLGEPFSPNLGTNHALYLNIKSTIYAQVHFEVKWSMYVHY